MSIRFEYSFNAPHDLYEVAGAVGRALGTPLVRAGESTFRGSLFAMTFVLRQHDLVDDRDLHFTNYRYQLSNTTWADSALRSIQLESLFLAAFTLHHVCGYSEGMLTYESQRLLARYDVVDGAWRDTTSGEVVNVGQHLWELQAWLERTFE